MGRVFTINISEFFFDALVQHIFSKYEKEKISELKIILPSKRDVIALLGAFKNYHVEKCIILPEVISLENIDEEDLILNLDKIQVITPTKRILLLIQFILEWNEQNDDNFPIDLAYSLSSLLDKVQYNHTSKTIDYNQSSEYSKKIENFIDLLIQTWSKILRDLEVVDILEHKKNYINDMILSLQNDQHVIFIGIGKNEIYQSLIKTVHDLPFGKIILPNLNFKIKEKDWKSLDKKHYQYCLKSLLDYLNIDRRDVLSIITECNAGIHTFFPGSQCQATRMTGNYIDDIFDTTANLSQACKGNNNNVEIITCDSEEEEAQVISLIIENEGYENVSLFVINKLLATRVACLLNQRDDNYPYITLLLYSIEVLTSNWNSIALLSLLKHKLVTFGYVKEEYDGILLEFEVEILRNFNVNSLDEIVSVVNEHKKIKYKEDILLIINNLKEIFNSLLNIINCTVSEMAAAHLQCVNMLSGINFLSLNNEIGGFISNFISACEGIAIVCSLEIYSRILILFLKRNFSSMTSDLNKFNLYQNKVVILAGFNEGSYPPSFQSPFLNSLIREEFNLPSTKEEQGYFLYTLHNLFYASKIYITRSANNRKPILLQRIETLLQGNLSKQPYRDWLRILNTPECVVPCTQPMPKPRIEVRKEKMQVMYCSAVEKLIRNPYSFYVEYILNLRKLRDLNSKPSILEFGTMVHSILEKYSRNKESLNSIVHKEFFSNRFYFSNMWWVRLQSIIQSFIELDETRGKHIEVEKSFSFPISQEIVLTAKCDRVEYLPGDQIAIIDYKLGSPPSNDEVMSGFFPQLILQALAVGYVTKKQVSELAYWKLDYDQIKVISLRSYREKMQEFQDFLPIFLSNYLNKEIPFTASPYLDKFLRINIYKHLERVGEWL
ncbi:MAG: PD-(D/E)XK nuclease family protein [Wolbachia sp.]|nr:PD-(D/E)XK nuclease family protein [Wolbachia sp.]